jgi:hypothetical protein
MSYAHTRTPARTRISLSFSLREMKRTACMVLLSATKQNIEDGGDDGFESELTNRF